MTDLAPELFAWQDEQLRSAGDADRRPRVANCALDAARRLARLDQAWPTLASGPRAGGRPLAAGHAAADTAT